MSRSYEQASLKAQARPDYTPNEGHADGSRDMWPVPARSRRRCHCGCNTRATHVGGNNAIALMGGCELSVRRWVRDGNKEKPCPATPLDLIAARAERASAGPWTTLQAADEETTTWLESPIDDVLHHDERGTGHQRENFSWMKRADAEFIAAARTDIVKLVAALRAVEAVIASMERIAAFNLSVNYLDSMGISLQAHAEILRDAIRGALEA